MRRRAERKTRRAPRTLFGGSGTPTPQVVEDVQPAGSPPEELGGEKEIALEQKHFDLAARRRDELCDIDELIRNSGASPGSQAALRDSLEKQARELGSADDPVAFGRIDFEDGDHLHIGRALIQSNEHDPLVVSMKAPVADAYYSATVADSRGLARKRTFRTTRNRIDHLDDLVFVQLAEDIARLTGGTAVDPDLVNARVDDGLLDELARHRTGEMAEIAKTIQASQHKIITAPYDRLLVVQGGPGTGKTAVALHRLSWMLYRERETVRPEQVLVVGPNPTFVRYIRNVLPELGDRNVRQTDISRLCAPTGVIGGRHEEPEVTRLKGEARMAALIRRALHDRVGTNPTGSYELEVGARKVVFTPEELEAEAQAIVDSASVYREGRDRLRSRLSTLVATRADVGETALPTSALERLLDRIWPQLNERSLLRDLFGSRDRLLSAAGEDFTAAEVGFLHRPSAGRVSEETWSDADLPLLDFAARGINGTPPPFRHVVVDEAQDLSPMELLALKGRIGAGATIVGDIAQSTSAWARDSWDDVMQVLRLGDQDEVVGLELGYRVPAEVWEVAEKILATAAPGVAPPRPVRPGGHQPAFHDVEADEFAQVAVERAMARSAAGNSVGIICPDRHRTEVVKELDSCVDKWADVSSGQIGNAINLVAPHQAKGLEFDAVVVVDPPGIVGDSAHGARMLYVAVTRTTTHLDMIQAEESHLAESGPEAREVGSAHEGTPVTNLVEQRTETVADGPVETPTWSRPPPGATPLRSAVDAIADAMATDLRATVRPDQFEAVLEAIRRRLDHE